jgi:hypothetical protein
VPAVKPILMGNRCKSDAKISSKIPMITVPKQKPNQAISTATAPTNTPSPHNSMTRPNNFFIVAIPYFMTHNQFKVITA